ncbi:MAG: sulfatase-like hydrolase/transferase [Proteiniphilum sp.]|nr:sulfatase-like hydrolase/transferase [Proteiniphilum sp.]
MKYYPVTMSLLLGGTFLSMAQEKPNIIIIYTDDMGYADLSCYGGDFVKTENIDRLAEEGIRFTQYYTAAPISSPSRVGITTGMYPTRWGIRSFLQTREGNRKNIQNDFLSDRAPSLARTLRDNGYRTAHFGKWHMGGGRDVDNAPSIYNYGFDEYVSTWESPDPDKMITASNWIWSDQDSIKRWNRTAYYVDKTLEFLKKNRDKPCYINLWPDDVHTPFVPNPQQLSTDKNDWEKVESFRYVLKEYDKQIGRLMQGLKSLGVDNNTLIIFSSDNGPNPSYGVERTKGLRGKKGTLYEGGIRMPFIVRWPSVIAPNQVNENSVLASVDIFPTLCSITESRISTDFPQDGEDRSDVILKNKNSERNKPVFWEFSRRKQTASGKENDPMPQVAVRWQEWKLLVFIDGSEVELYNMEDDLLEQNNVADQYKSTAERLKFEALRWFSHSFREFANINK